MEISLEGVGMQGGEIVFIMFLGKNWVICYATTIDCLQIRLEFQLDAFPNSTLNNVASSPKSSFSEHLCNWSSKMFKNFLKIASKFPKKHHNKILIWLSTPFCQPLFSSALKKRLNRNLFLNRFTEYYIELNFILPFFSTSILMQTSLVSNFPAGSQNLSLNLIYLDLI